MLNRVGPDPPGWLAWLTSLTFVAAVFMTIVLYNLFHAAIVVTDNTPARVNSILRNAEPEPLSDTVSGEEEMVVQKKEDVAARARVLTWKAIGWLWVICAISGLSLLWCIRPVRAVSLPGDNDDERLYVRDFRP